MSIIADGHRAHAARMPPIVDGTGAAHGAVADGGTVPPARMMRVRTPHRARGHRRGAWSRS
jgi:hypothetical protein